MCAAVAISVLGPIEGGHRVKSGIYDIGFGLKTSAMLIREVGRFSDIHDGISWDLSHGRCYWLIYVKPE
jgi:hypothetical protein